MKNKEHPLYQTWASMKGRCYNPKASNFGNYGGRGITVCERWRNDFWAFVADMGEKPARGMSIDRMDGNKGYEPSNCRWATASEQNLNRRKPTITEKAIRGRITSANTRRGAQRSDETRALMREKAKARWANAATRKEQSQRMTQWHEERP